MRGEDQATRISEAAGERGQGERKGVPDKPMRNDHFGFTPATHISNFGLPLMLRVIQPLLLDTNAIPCDPPPAVCRSPLPGMTSTTRRPFLSTCSTRLTAS